MKKIISKGEGLRFNSGKPRYELVFPEAYRDFVSVLTYGAEKYTERDKNGEIVYDGSMNWREGLSWMDTIASLERHIAAYKMGEDFDPESGLLHMSHAACNVHFLNSFYYIFPEGDDRPQRFLKPRKIGLDIDDVVADLIGALGKRFPDSKEPEYWNDHSFIENFPKIIDDVDFWMNVPPKCSLPFEPHCYVTARSIDSKITAAWLRKYGFPKAPVYTVPRDSSKVDAVRNSGADIFVDDSYNNFVDLNNAGIFCYLFDAHHNRRYNVGHRRIISLSELV